MKMVSLNDATASLADYARQVETQPVIVTKRGKPVAALVSVRDADAETIALSINPRFLAMLERSRESVRREGPVSADEMHRRVLPRKRRRRRS